MPIPTSTFTIPEADLALAQEVVRPNLVKDRMLQGQIATSLGLRICLSSEMALLAQRAGYQALLMNLEHSATGLETAAIVATACLNVGVTPMVVVPSATPEWISRSLDAGVQAVIIPHVDDVETAQLCVDAGKFAPLGKRSMTMLNAITQYATGIHFRAVAKVSNETTLIMPMIETRRGLSNVEAIAAVPGIDCLLMGCADLCVDLDIPGEHDNPIFLDAVDKIAAAATAAGVFVGLGGLEGRPDLLETLCRKWPCIRYLMAGRDIVHLFNGMKVQAKAMSALNDAIAA